MQGQLFTQDFLTRGVKDTPPWRAQTESEVITKMLAALALGDPQAQKHSLGSGQFTRQQFTPEYLDELHEATLTLLYRLLFLSHAEDRNLLPVRDANYEHYSFQRIRASIRGHQLKGIPFASSIDPLWQITRDLCAAVYCGDDSIGMPSCKSPLFHPLRAPLLARTHIADSAFATIISAFDLHIVKAPFISSEQEDITLVALGDICERSLRRALATKAPASDNVDQLSGGNATAVKTMC